jgi:hypothetical protein
MVFHVLNRGVARMQLGDGTESGTQLFDPVLFP